MPPQDNKTDQVIHLFLQLFQVIGSLLWTWGMLKFFTNPHEKVTWILLLQTISIGVVLNYILLIPFDIFVTVRHSDVRLFQWTDPVTHHNWLPRMYDLYLISYVLILLFGFIFVPFQIFYIKSVQEEDDLLLETQIISQEATSAGANKSKRMHSSNNSDEEETINSSAGNYHASSYAQPHAQISSSSMSDSKHASQAMNFVKDFYNDSPKEQDIMNIYTRTSIQKFSYHGQRASKRTCLLIVILATLILLSRWVADNEYESVHEEYEKVHDDVSKKVGHHIDKNKKSNSKMKKGEDDDIESEEEYEQESNQFFFQTFFGDPDNNSSSVNVTHFFEQSKKRAHAIYNSIEYKKFNNWKHQLMDNLQEDESSLRLVLTSMICLGSILNCIYMTYGMAGLPVQLIKCQIDLEPTSEQSQGSIQQVRDQLRIIQEKYRGRMRHHISDMDKQNYKKLKREEKHLSFQNGPMNTNEQTKIWRQISAFLQFVNVHRIEIGKVCLITSLLICISMMITNVDRFKHSQCGFKCGYLLDEPTMFNPLDYLLRRLSSKHDYFVNIEMYLDIALFVLMSLYCIVCIFFSFVKIGINFFTYEIYKIKRRETLPQALSIGSVLIILMMISFSMQVMTIAPIYTMFGDQRVDKQKMEQCTLKNGKSKHDGIDYQADEEEGQGDWGLNRQAGFGCQMSMMSQVYNKMELGLPAFAILEYFMHWAFILTFFIFLAYHSHYKESYLQKQMGADYAQLSLNEGDDQDEDLNLFLKSTLNKNSSNHLQNAKQEKSENNYDASQSWDSHNNFNNQYDQYNQHYQYDQYNQQYQYNDEYNPQNPNI